MNTPARHYDWSDLAFSSKKPLKSLSAVFIAAPRQLSAIRLAQLVRQNIATHSIILGLAKEDFIDGFQGQPQFKTLKLESVDKLIQKINASNFKNKIYTISYYQRETVYLIEKLNFAKVLFVNGSWKYVFQVTEPFFRLIKHSIPYELVSPFADEDEAMAYAASTRVEPLSLPEDLCTQTDMMSYAASAARQSYDYGFQTGAALALRQSKHFKLLTTACNTVVPYQTYAMHFGASRERNFSPPNDLNFYDTVHAEVNIILNALSLKLELTDTALFINLLPCPPCARMVAASPISEIVYIQDHSAGYAVALLEKAGKIVRRCTSLGIMDNV